MAAVVVVDEFSFELGSIGRGRFVTGCICVQLVLATAIAVTVDGFVAFIVNGVVEFGRTVEIIVVDGEEDKFWNAFWFSVVAIFLFNFHSRLEKSEKQSLTSFDKTIGD